MRFATGTRTSSKVSSAVGEPDLHLVLDPRRGESRRVGLHDEGAHALPAARLGSVSANTVSTFATEPWVMKRLLPFRT